MELAPGNELLHYRLVEPIGEGGGFRVRCRLPAGSYVTVLLEALAGPARIMGGALYGGPVGLLSAAANAVYAEANGGQDLGDGEGVGAGQAVRIQLGHALGREAIQGRLLRRGRVDRKLQPARAGTGGERPVYPATR